MCQSYSNLFYIVWLSSIILILIGIFSQDKKFSNDKKIKKLPAADLPMKSLVIPVSIPPMTPDYFISLVNTHLPWERFARFKKRLKKYSEKVSDLIFEKD